MKTTIGKLKLIIAEASKPEKTTPLTTTKARKEFPEAIAALGGDEDLRFWKDHRGYLHCDDSLHSAFDDMWDPKTKEWVGSDIAYPGSDEPYERGPRAADPVGGIEVGATYVFVRDTSGEGYMPDFFRKGDKLTVVRATPIDNGFQDLVKIHYKGGNKEKYVYVTANKPEMTLKRVGR